MAEHIALRFDWHDVDARAITAVLGQGARTMNDGSARWDAVAICLGSTAIMLTVEINTDQVIVTHEPVPSGEGWSAVSSFDFALGKAVGWCWIGINSQGYKDCFTVAFTPDEDRMPGALTPRCTFVAEAFSLRCFDLAARMA